MAPATERLIVDLMKGSHEVWPGSHVCFVASETTGPVITDDVEWVGPL